MSKRSIFAGGVAAVMLLGAGAALGAPSYCPTSSSTVCSGRQVGDILIGLHANGRILGLDPSTGSLYTFSSAFEQYSNVELGDLAVMPSDPLHVVAVGNLDNGIGVRRLDSCGNLDPEIYGPFPQHPQPPIPPYDKGGMIGRGIVFNPLNGTLYWPFRSTTLLGGTDWFHLLFAFPPSGGQIWGELVSSPTSEMIEPGPPGLIAADELGVMYFASGRRIAAIPSITSGDPHYEEYTLSGDAPSFAADIVHDGNHHLYVSGHDENNRGFIWRVGTMSGVSEIWAFDRGPSYGYDAYNSFMGMTIDAQGDLWAIESLGTNDRAGIVKLSREDGSLLAYYPLPLEDAWKNPWSLAVLGVNLPTVREACASDCENWEISDCSGACMPGGWLGDNVCDDDPGSNSSCWGRGGDLGDCNFCPPGEVADCNGHCAPIGWVGDGFCDAGGWWHNGQAVSFDCAAFRFDETTCRSCGFQEKLDCNGNCSPSFWYGDGVCDDGSYWFGDHPVDYHCVEYDFDRNDCPVGG